MKVRVEEVSPIKKKLFIDVSQEEYLKELDLAYQRLQKKVSIRGFRKGKAPRSILEQNYKDQVESDVLSHLLEHSYVDALRDQKINPVAQPKVSDLKREENQSLSYVAEVEVMPTIAVKDYKKIKLKKEAVEVLEEDLQKELESLRQNQAQILPIEEEVSIAQGHIALIDFVGRLNGEAFEGGSGKAVSVEVGSGRFIPDFEKGLIGMKKGETRKVEVNFPADYPTPTLAGKKTEFEMTINDIKKKVLPELNDDFARDLGQFDSLEAVKTKIKEGLAQQKEQASRNQLFGQILDHLIEKHPFEIPDAMIEEELGAMLENTRRRLEQQRLTLEQVGITPESFRTQNREAAQKRVKGFLLFDAVARHENIQVSGEEIKARIAKIAAGYGQNPEVVERYYNEQRLLPHLQTQILEEKILDFLIAEANVSS